MRGLNIPKVRGARVGTAPSDSGNWRKLNVSQTRLARLPDETSPDPTVVLLPRDGRAERRTIPCYDIAKSENASKPGSPRPRAFNDRSNVC